MTISFEAIYMDGVLRPLIPTDLKEGETVWVSVESYHGKARSKSSRLPDVPLGDDSIAVPWDLPRKEGKTVSVKSASGRLPDAIGLQQTHVSTD